MKRLVVFAVVASLAIAGCKSADSDSPAPAGDPPKRAPKTATLYVDAKGEPVNAGGKKVEKADESGKPSGEFSAKDVLLPGMFLLVSGATATGGAILIKALDKKDKPSGPAYVESGGEDGTLVPLDKAADSTAAGSGSGASGSGSSGSGAPGTGSGGGGASAPDPGSVTAVGKAGSGPTAAVLSAGRGVVSTPSSILLSMGYASDFTGTSYITGKMTGSTTWDFGFGEVHIYKWVLSLDRTKVSSGERVDMFATFTGLPKGTYVALDITIKGEATMTCDHVPLVKTLDKEKGPGDAWYFKSSDDLPAGHLIGGGHRYVLLFRLETPDSPVRIGYLTVTGEVDVDGSSTATLTIP